ncbi:MAG TPA: TatD family hydrolase [Vicinamibacterales bacterium]|nr:TatD family hydrolase [Vicinamibacterales bacterium]
MIDSHCHLAGTEFAGDLSDVIARAQAAGVTRCLVILAADDDAEIEQSERVRTAWPEVRFAVGVHPHSAHKFADGPDGAAGLTANRLDLVPGACAVGEIGLDYHYDVSPRDVQQAVFRAQLRLARERRLPVIIHTREAEEDTLRIIAEESQDNLRGVFHCFTGGVDAAARALATGFHVSIPGIVTFPKAGDLREAVRTIPDDRLLIETDSPYLAPLPHRGKRNEPAYVAKVLEVLTDVRVTEDAVLRDILVGNFDRLFGSSLSA